MKKGDSGLYVKYANTDLVLAYFTHKLPSYHISLATKKCLGEGQLKGRESLLQKEAPSALNTIVLDLEQKMFYFG